nr:ATP-dependent DNA helicase DDX11 isoform X2 [Arachis hypogaea]
MEKKTGKLLLEIWGKCLRRLPAISGSGICFVWPSVISTGPGNYPLNESYKAADGYAFQDAVGRSLEEIFNIVLGGCLVFFLSYKLMEKLCNRWSKIGQWSRLNAKMPLYVSELSIFFWVLSEYVLDLLVFGVNNLIMVLRSKLMILKLIVYGFSP